MLRRTFKYSVIFCVILLLLMGAGVVTLVTIDLNRFKPELEAYIKKTTGRELVVKGKFLPSFSLTPAFETHDVTFQNASWGSKTEMASIGTLQVKIALLPLLHKEIRIKNIVAKDASLLLEENVKGTKNWDIFPSNKTKTESGFTFTIDQVTLENTIIAYFEQKQEKALITVDSFVLKREDDRIKTNFAGIYNHIPLLIESTIAQTATLKDGTVTTSSVITTKNSSVTVKASVDHLFDNPAIKGKITGKSLVIDDFIPVKDIVGEIPPPPPSATVLSNKPIPFESLKNINADLTLDLEKLQYRHSVFTGLQSKIALHHSILSVAPFKATLANGALSGKVNLDGNAKPPLLTIALDGEQMHTESLLKTMQILPNLTDGSINFKLETTAKGNSLHAIAASLNGEANIYLEKARYHSKADLGSAEGFFNVLTGKKDGNSMRINCAATVFGINDGIASSKAMVMDTTGALVTGTGQTDMGKETLAFVFTPKAKTVGVADLVVPMRWQGTYQSAKLSPDKKGFLQKVGKTALSVATGGVSTLSFIAVDMVKKLGIPARGNVCLAAISAQSSF